MKILFTGASSFTGMWFIQELHHAGHDVTAIFRRPYPHYEGMRKKRIDNILSLCHPVFEASFGDDKFLSTILSQSHWDLFCHHAADVSDYKSPHFNVSQAITSNTFNIKKVLETLKNNGCNHVVLTGSVFEQNEGKGTDGVKAISPYGLSKGLTADIFSFYTNSLDMRLNKFVIPNPFGPYEEARFTSYLMTNWIKGEKATVKTPLYIRDNIPVSLLAKAYAHYACLCKHTDPSGKCNPSYFVESQGVFTERFSREMRQRTSLACAYELETQMIFNEPLVRTNTDYIDTHSLQWDENSFWDFWYRWLWCLCLIERKCHHHSFTFFFPFWRNVCRVR